MKRLNSIDFIKVIGIITMIQIHLGMYLLSYSARTSNFYHFMSFLGKIAAPLFLFAVGINLVISVNNRKKQAKPHIFKRSLFLFIFGLLFLLIWQPSILHFIGLYLFLAYVLLFFSDKIKILAITILTFGSLWLLKFIDYSSGWELLPYRLAGLWTIKGFFKNLLVTGYYPIFPCLAYVIIGTIVGKYLIKSIKNKDLGKFTEHLLIAGAIISVIGLALTKITPWNLGFYPMQPPYILFFSGLNMVLLSAGLYLLDIKKKFPDFSKLMNFMGSTCLSIYILHVIVGLSYFYFTSNFQFLSMIAGWIYIITILIIITLISYVFKKKLGYGPFEYLMNVFVSDSKNKKRK